MKVHYGWLTGRQRSHIKPSKKTWPIGQPGAKPPLQIPFVTKNGGPYPICDPSNMADNLMKSRILCLLIYLISIPRFAKKSRNYTWRLANLQLEFDPNLTRTRPYLEPEQNPNSTQQKRRYIFLLLFHVMLWLLPPLRFMRQAKLLPLYDVPPPSLSSMAYLEQDNFDR